MSIKITLPNDNGTDFKLSLTEESRIAIITGAGVSVGSGLPTYYGKGGLYTGLDERPEDILNAHNMKENQYKIWDAITPLIDKGLSAKPSISHLKLAEIQSFVKDSAVFTQNVDPLHKKAGSKNITQIHGNAEECVCYKCKSMGTHTVKSMVDVLPELEKGKAPKCNVCDTRSIVPDIVAFGQMLSEDTLYKMYDFFSKPVDLIIVVGTQLSFEYIEYMFYDAKKHNPDVKVIDINPDAQHDNCYATKIFNQNSDTFFEKVKIEQK